MRRDIAEIWCAALESGEYKQGKNRLRDYVNQYCCLGVLCDLHRRLTGDGEWQDSRTSYECYEYRGQGSACDAHVPEDVTLWAGLQSDNGTLDPDCSFNCLVTANDSRVDFQEIAKIIREQMDYL